MQPSYAQSTTTAGYDEGLRSYLLSVFNYMTTALMVSGLISAYIGYNTALAQAIWATPFKWVAVLAPLGISLLIGFTAHKMSTYAAKVWLMVFAAAMGVSLSSIFLSARGLEPYWRSSRQSLLCVTTIRAKHFNNSWIYRLPSYTF